VAAQYSPVSEREERGEAFRDDAVCRLLLSAYLSGHGSMINGNALS
jgi:hypothetical protein